MLKHFPYQKLGFNPRAKCLTIAPDRYEVLLSQRRRWINSTVHNLAELLFVDQMCGFCCFSMRFVVFIDLFSTIVQPAGIIYLIYLLGKIAYDYITLAPDRQVPVIALYLLAAVYGMQAFIFIVKREFQHIGWMIIYILAMPVFGFILPVYAFWHFDDFSWGNTRTIFGDDGKKKVMIKNVEKFDLNEIPHKKWSDYEKEVMDMQNSMTKVPVGQARSLTLFSENDKGSTKSSTVYSVRSPQSESRKRMVFDHSDEFVQDSGPTDYELYSEVKRILSVADLNVITKKQVRYELSTFFGTELSHRKEYINQCIDQVLLELQK
eukprot:NODE_276_length_10970_cov_0.627909.p2 type:complete len:321 gc:universal NODE_276_length_10970_cov_0.627909:866-1828(+)